MRVPNVDPNRDKLIKHFEKKLAYFEAITSHRRSEEMADEGEATCRALLAHLFGDSLPEAGDKGAAASLGDWLDEIEEEAINTK